MSGYRDPSPHEAYQYLQAIEKKNAKQLQHVVSDLYPNVVWSSATNTLSEEDRKWALDKLMSATADEE